MTKEKSVILGAGLAGLSAAWHLQKMGRECLIFEKELEAGGLCRSKNLAGFTFDYCGHLLHFKQRYTFNLIKSLLKDNLLEHKKNAWVYSHARFTRYPFQANLYGLPQKIIKECLTGFIRISGNGHAKKKKIFTFLDWIEQTFGQGIARNFMVPYNTKFWTVSPRKLTAEWLDGFIPVPTLREIIEGTIEENRRGFGYNTVFWYPKRGGIREIPRLFSSRIRNLHLSYEAVQLDIKNKKIYFRNNEKEEFSRLIFTLPLPEILNLCKELPDKVIKALNSLRYTSIFNLNLGIDRQSVSDKHWIYFPEKKFAFYRIGFPSNFSPQVFPSGTSSLYIEVAYSKTMPLNKNTISERIIKDLKKAAILRQRDRILVKDVNDIKYGYIIYDKAMAEATRIIKNFLASHGIFCLGRYGSWKYLSMEDVFIQGRVIASFF